jgi:hypothetical protein
VAHFIGFIRGTRGEASRLGGKEGGIRSRVQGWQSGVKVIGRHAGGKDWFQIWATSGSDSSTPEQLVATVGRKDNNELFAQLAKHNPVLIALENLLDCIGAVANAGDCTTRAVEKENLNEAVVKARVVVRENLMPNSAEK